MAVCHSQNDGWVRVQDLDKLSDLRSTSGNLLWAEADVTDLTPEDVATIAEEFSLHPLAVEDATNDRQRPKLEPYDNHLFIVLHQLNEVESQLESAQLRVFRRGTLRPYDPSRGEEDHRRGQEEVESPPRPPRTGAAHLIHTLMT